MDIKLKAVFSFSSVKYMCLIGAVISYVFFGLSLTDWLYNEQGWSLEDAFEHYGVILTVILYMLTAGIYISVPFSALNLVGLLLFNPFCRKRNDAVISTETPFICFRVVTRGTFPVLVQDVTSKNLEICMRWGLKNFKFEIVSDNVIDLPSSHYVREVVVPRDYKTTNGTLFKARALHYSLDHSVNILSLDDWIVHLDEETLLTEDVLHGIVDFVNKPNSSIGQGVITYGGGTIENWITTLMDGVRTAIDYGLFRLALQLFHRPVFGIKGSFLVVKMRVESDIGFDFGPTESIAEDLRFALTAWNKGYLFDFVNGVMQEKSTFTLADFVKQRKRWLIGHFHVIWNDTLPLYCKMGVLPLHLGNLMLWMNVLSSISSFVLPVPQSKWQLTLFLLLTLNFNLMIMFGNYMSLSFRPRHFIAKFIICFLAQFLLLVLGILESYAALLGFYHRNTLKFDIVQKEIGTRQVKVIRDSSNV